MPIKSRVFIHKPPQQANARQEVVHWEADLMAFLSHAKLMLVVYEGVTRVNAPPLKLANKTASETLKCLITFFQRLPKELVKLITFDNGGERAKLMTRAQLLGQKPISVTHTPHGTKAALKI